MRRSWILAVVGGAFLFATTDVALNAVTVWLIQNGFLATSAIFNELFLRAFPPALAGLVAGYLAYPQGFGAALFAGAAGAVISLAVRNYQTIGWVASDGYNAAAISSWVAGIAVGSGICGWAGERLRMKRDLRPDKSPGRTSDG